jgi:hypothetical protein
MALIGRITTVVTFAAVVALLTIFARPLWQGADALFSKDSQSSPASKPDRLNASNAAANNPRVAAAGIAATPGAETSASAPLQQAPQAPFSATQGQQASLAPAAQPLGQNANGGQSSVRGVSSSEIRFGISAPFSGAAKELGQNMKMGIVAAFNAANANGGIYGRQLRLTTATSRPGRPKR